MVEFCLTLFLSFPGCSHPGLVGTPSPGFDFTGLVAWLLLAPWSWKPPSQSTPFARSVVFWRWCGADYSLPLVSSLLAARFGLWPYGLAIAAFPRGWVCFGDLAGAAFHLGVSMHGLPRMVGLLAALLEVCLPGLSGWCLFRVTQILWLTSLPRGWS